MITEIKLISCDGKVLELDFDGESRTFFIEGTKSENVENIGATFEVDLQYNKIEWTDFVVE